MLIVRLVTRTGVTHNDRVYSGPFDVCKRRDQGTLGAKKHGGMPPGQAPRGKRVFRNSDLQMLQG